MSKLSVVGQGGRVRLQGVDGYQIKLHRLKLQSCHFHVSLRGVETDTSSCGNSWLWGQDERYIYGRIPIVLHLDPFGCLVRLLTPTKAIPLSLFASRLYLITGM
jgi:hypothetical protein